MSYTLNSLILGRFACLVLGWLSLQLSGHIVLCRGQDGHVSVELAFYEHCDAQPLTPETAGGLLDIPEISATAGCQDTPVLTDIPHHDGVRVLRVSTARAALDGLGLFPASTLPRQGGAQPAVRDRSSPPPHLSHLRTIVLLT